MTDDYRVRFDRDYSAAEHALFAEYEDARARLRPQQCTSGDRCWVRFGPPYYRPRGPLGGCAGCGGRIKRRVADD